MATVKDGAKFGCGCVLGIAALFVAGIVLVVFMFRAGAANVQEAREKAKAINERKMQEDAKKAVPAP